MSSLTQNLRLIVPVFDQVPWDVDVNTNWTILDAAVGMFAAIPNLVGVWKNATAYTYGQSVIDAANSSIWLCVQTHTSSALPTTFSQERVTYPVRWTQTTQGASFYAQQAASSAAAAAASAASAASDAASAANKVPLAGGTMTGQLILYGDPTNVLGAVPKQYVDARVGGVGYLPITGGTLTGPLYAGSTGIGYMNIGAADRALISFGYNSSTGTIYVDQNGFYVGGIATHEFVGGNYLPLSGGSITGTLYVNGNLQTPNTLTLTQTGATFYADGTYTYIISEVNGTRLQFHRPSNSLALVRGYDNTTLASFAGDGTNLLAGTLKVVGGLETDGPFYARRGEIFFGASDRSKLITDNNSYTIVQMIDNVFWLYDWSTANLHWQVNGNNFFSILVSNTKVGNNLGPVYGAGAYEIVSDERMKMAIQPARYGLPEIMELKPIRFIRTTGNKKEEEGFSAQQLQQVMPTAVSDIGDEATTLAITLDPIVVALVNGMKELSMRLNALENR